MMCPVLCIKVMLELKRRDSILIKCLEIWLNLLLLCPWKGCPVCFSLLRKLIRRGRNPSRTCHRLFICFTCTFLDESEKEDVTLIKLARIVFENQLCMRISRHLLKKILKGHVCSVFTKIFFNFHTLWVTYSSHGFIEFLHSSFEFL